MSLPFDPKVQSALDESVLYRIKKRLQEFDEELWYVIENAQTREEAKEGFTSHFKNELGEHICVPEDAAPFVDGARGLINDAVSHLDQAIKMREFDHES